MAGITSVLSDSEGSTKVTSKTKDKPAALDSAAPSGDEQEDDGSEYEIEEVLDAKRGFFPDGRMGYFVKWKGYDHTENSWVDELDAGNAVDLVEEYWSKNPAKKKAAALPPKKSPKKARKSTGGEETSDADATATKKRARKSSTKKSGNDADEMDVDEAPPKKARKSSTQVAKVKARAPETPEVDEPVIGNMTDYMHMNNWEPLVKTVDTIERRQDGDLVAYFTLTTSESVMENLTICKKRFPQKLLDFYETNLRWRSIDEEVQ